MKRIRFALAALLLLPLLAGATKCQDTPPPGQGAPPIHVRLVVTWKARSVPGTLTIVWSEPGSNDQKHVSVHRAGRDDTVTADLGAHETLLAHVGQTTGGIVQCWVEEITSKGQLLSQLTPTQTMTVPSQELECTYTRGPVD